MGGGGSPEGVGFGFGSGRANLVRIPQGHDVWGRIGHFRGVITHHLSPFEQRAFAGWISHGAPNMVRRVRSQLFKMGVPVMLGLLVYTWAVAEHEKVVRKDLNVYEKEYQEYLVSDEYKTYLSNKEKEEKAAAKKK